MNMLGNMLGKWRGYRPNPERLYLLLAASLIGLLALGIFFFVALSLVPKVRLRGELIGVVATAEQAVVLVEQTSAAAPAQAQTQVATAQAAVGAAAAAFLSDAEATAALNRLYQYARDSAVTITALKAQPSPQAATADVVQVNTFGLQVTGTLPQLLNFLARIQETARTGFLIDNVNITENAAQETAPANGATAHTASMNVRLYTSPYVTNGATQPITVVITPVPPPVTTPLSPTLALPTLPVTTPGCSTLLTNGDFESDGAWIVGDALAPPFITSNQKQAGLRAMALGTPPEMGSVDRSQVSTIRQLVNLPTNVNGLTLRWWHLYGTSEAVVTGPDVLGDRQEVLLMTAEGQVVATMQRTRRNDSGWQQESVDLTAYRGQSLYLTFSVVNDGNGLATWMYVDSVQIDSCTSGGLPPAPTPLPPIPTPTPVSPPPPTNTPLVVPTPTPVVLPPATNTPLPPIPPPTPPIVVPTPTLPPATATAPASCTNLLSNGDFEGDGGWLIGPTALLAQFTTSQKHGGARALALGSTPERGANNGNSYSSIRQLITLPATASVLTLRWWQLYGSAEAIASDPGTTGDRQEVLLLTPDGRVLVMLQRVRRHDNGWQQTVVDLSAYRGQTVYLYLNVYNNGNGAATWAYIDDVQIDTCGGATPAPTATNTAVAPTATPTPTNTVVVIPTVTSSATLLPPTVAPTATPTATPTVIVMLSPTATPTVAGNCTNLLANGDFEADGGWLLGQVATLPQIITSQQHSGARAMQLGNPPAAGLDKQSYSSIRQLVTLPPNAATVILRWWSLAGTQEAVTADPGVAADRQEILLLAQNEQLLAVVQRVRRNDAGWQETAVDLTPYRGQSIYLYLNVFNDGNGVPTWLYVDDIQMNACL